ncbi:MAG: beta-phosphoglucomutase [Agathobacter sp.]|nr:beta-phosphoglucomutase [Agathobacter sp.]
MQIKGIIFDLDGVIVSTDEYHYKAWKALADRLGIIFDREINNRFRGVSRLACMDILEELSGKEYDNEQKQEYANWKNELYINLLSQMSPNDVSDEVKETLTILRKRGIRLAIGSSSKNAKYILQKLEMKEYFDAISDGTNIEKSKPDPEVFLKAADFLGLSPEDCLVVEDAVSGVDAARAGGMKTAVVGDAAEKQYGDFILNSFSDIVSII